MSEKKRIWAIKQLPGLISQIKKLLNFSNADNSLYIGEDISGTFGLDWSEHRTWLLTLTGNTTLVDKNLPPLGSTGVITIKVTGEFTLTVPAGWGLADTYDGTLDNHITVEYFIPDNYSSQINAV
jgi:hypothetical protein